MELGFLLIAGMLLLSVVASQVSDRIGVPALLLFLALGMLAGTDGLGIVDFNNPGLAQSVGLFALSIILFSGGLDAEWKSIRKVIKEALTLATVGVFITAALMGVAVHYIIGMPWLEAMLLGAIVSSTDAAAVFAMLRSQGVRLAGNLSPLLEAESGSNDPMAVFLTIGLIQLILSPDKTPLALIGLFVQQMVIGGLFGLIMGRLFLYFINRLRLGYDGLYPVLMLGSILLTFALPSLLGGSGILAVYLLGLILGSQDFRHKRGVSRFYDGLAWLSQIVMFFTLGLLVNPSELPPIAIPGLALAGILMFVARPISVWISLIPFHLSAREKTLVSWVGLRGAVPIILATYPSLSGLDPHGIIFHVVLFVVLTSVLIQGSSLTLAARWLKVDDPNEPEPKFPVELATLRGWHGELREVVVQAHSPLVGLQVREIGLPQDYLVVLIARNDEFLIPHGDIILQANDRLLGLAQPETHQEVDQMVGLEGQSLSV